MSFLTVTLDDLTAIARVMVELEEQGGGWINLVPAGTERTELSATRSVPGMIFGRIGGRGPAVPRITWTAPEQRRNRIDPAQIGIEHPAGPRAARLLSEANHPVPPAWPVLQDHAIRGLVVAVSDPDASADHESVIEWALIAAGLLIGTDVRSWQARVFHR